MIQHFTKVPQQHGIETNKQQESLLYDLYRKLILKTKFVILQLFRIKKVTCLIFFIDACQTLLIIII